MTVSRWHQHAGRALLVAALLQPALPATALDPQRPLRAGAASRPMALPDGVPLAGYGARGPRHRSRGMLAPVEARALVLENDGIRLGLVVLDVLVVWPSLRAAIEDRVADLGLDALVVAATHTHSGPGAYIDLWLAEIGISGRYRVDTADALARAGVQALRRAEAALVPARLGSAHASAPELVRNRRRGDGPADPSIPVLRVDTVDGEPLATLFALAAHPVVLSPRNDQLSPDYPGAARRQVEDARGGIAIFLAGPLGDQDPALPGHVLWTDDNDPPLLDQVRASEALGAVLADRVLEAAAHATTHTTARLGFHSLRWPLPGVDVRIRCVGVLPGPILHRVAARALSRVARIDALRLGDLLLLASPFELGVEVAAAIREGLPLPVLVAAHANDWLGYLLLPEDHARGGYEPCLSFHGPRLAPAFVEQATRALSRLVPAQEQSAGR